MTGVCLKMIFLFLLIAIPLVCGDRIVKTNSGPVKGKSLAPQKVEAFLGIPYAEPPVGPLRFARPVAKSSWEETYDASRLPPACVQFIMEGLEHMLGEDNKMQEDCLYLNLWVPEGGSDPKPIMLFIHGGGFMMGSSNMKIYDGTKLSANGDVIVASINYRLGSLGFFAGLIDEAAGSMGMYDQVMAIQWIKDNAKHFGGDPDNIVLFGESAGAFSVSLHMISPLSKHLFKRGILQSGSAFHPMYSDNNKALFGGSQAIASMLGCADDPEALKKNPQSVVECMKNLPVEKFPEVDLLYLQRYGILFPRVGDGFLPESPADLFWKSDFKDTELLLGVTRDEGTMLLGFLKPDVFGLLGNKVDPSNFNGTLAKEVFQFATKVDGDSEIFRRYLDRVKGETRYTILNALADAVGDYIITCGAVFEADYRSLKDNPVYFYVFDYGSPSSPFAKWMGVIHSEELPYVFGNPFFYQLNDYEEELSKDVMDMWAAFAKTGNPNIPGGLEWPRYTHEDPKYFSIGQRDRVGVKPDNYRCEAWKKFFGFDIDDDDAFKNEDSDD